MSSWFRPRTYLYLPAPIHDGQRLPVPRQTRFLRKSWSGERALPTMIQGATTQSRRKEPQIVVEFRNKMRLAEDLISKLAFSLREIQGTRKKSKEKAAGRTARPSRAGQGMATILSVTRSRSRKKSDQ